MYHIRADPGVPSILRAEFRLGLSQPAVGPMVAGMWRGLAGCAEAPLETK